MLAPKRDFGGAEPIPGYHGGFFFGPFGVPKSQKNVENAIPKNHEKRSPKNMNIDAKKVPKWSQNRCKHSSKISAKTGSGKYEENHGKSCFSDV